MPSVRWLPSLAKYQPDAPITLGSGTAMGARAQDQDGDWDSDYADSADLETDIAEGDTDTADYFTKFFATSREDVAQSGDGKIGDVSEVRSARIAGAARRLIIEANTELGTGVKFSELERAIKNNVPREIMDSFVFSVESLMPQDADSTSDTSLDFEVARWNASPAAKAVVETALNPMQGVTSSLSGRRVKTQIATDPVQAAYEQAGLETPFADLDQDTVRAIKTMLPGLRLISERNGKPIGSLLRARLEKRNATSTKPDVRSGADGRSRVGEGPRDAQPDRPDADFTSDTGVSGADAAKSTSDARERGDDRGGADRVGDAEPRLEDSGDRSQPKQGKAPRIEVKKKRTFTPSAAAKQAAAEPASAPATNADELKAKAVEKKAEAPVTKSDALKAKAAEKKAATPALLWGAS